MKVKASLLVTAALASALTLSACSNDSSSSKKEEPKQEAKKPAMNHENMDGMEGMNHKESSELPKGLVKAQHPQFKEGSKITLMNDHMAGMKNAKGTVKGAYDTYTYEVSYEPTNGGKPVKNHKWVVQEELKAPKAKPVQKGGKVTLNVDHMAGMKGAVATVDSVKKQTVYVVDYTSTTDGKEVKNHKWMTGDELKAR
ncbi:hypothetical protein A374_15918 [Fictibacillus macauensis ZFHKF-1]|uniref:DUF1541 domain-containing protein n=1 Tax=Fictibacillus macauensis ZFHKF-1 TaxID=1196324 RepID=I8UBW8_9BACL|nr:YdhK family protein [Fictibacillus macauensis]EIT84288.1 hypothetical protein A374_15918 [Fictibacillus macauensis ZFHKF-1]